MLSGLWFQGLKGEAGGKGRFGPFGARGPVGQKVSFSKKSVEKSVDKTA